MEVRPWPSRDGSQDLSRANPFFLGELAVDPPTRQVARNNQAVVLEPRVMRVLVALAGCGGKVMSRNDLITRCWDGQIVGNGAIDRVISRLRAVLTELGDDAVKLETVTKVGFRLVIDPSSPGKQATQEHQQAVVTDIEPPGVRTKVSRRDAVLLVAGAVVLTGPVGWSAYRSMRSHTVDPIALELYERGVALKKSAIPNNNLQALTFFKRAVATDPHFADAWGALAIGYTFERSPNPRQIASAAKQALAIDPAQADALLALIVGPPFYRRWDLVEPKLHRFVLNFPDHWYGSFLMGSLLRSVGRHRDALPFARHSVETDPTVPIVWSGLASNLLNLGQLDESDAALEEGVRRWPGHPDLWFTRYGAFMSSQRFAEAAEFARDSDNAPVPWPPHFAATYGGLAEAAGKGDAKGVKAGRAYFRGILRKEEDGTLEAVPRFGPLLAAIGAREDAMTAFEAYLLGGDLFGRKIIPPRDIDTRFTHPLFSPPMLARRNVRYERLLERAGFESYWKRSGSQPDFRRN